MDNPPLRLSFPLGEGSASTPAMHGLGAMAEVEVVHSIGYDRTCSIRLEGGVGLLRPKIEQRCLGLSLLRLE